MDRSVVSASAPPVTTGAPARILLVEDSATQAVFTRSVLESAGHTVEVARNGRDGLTAARNGPFDIVITDVRMPLLDGFDLCRSLKDEFAGRLPVVLLTSVTDAQDVVRTLEAGADNFVGKPFQPSVLLERIERTLQRTRTPTGDTRHEQMNEILLSTIHDALAANVQLRERDEQLARAHATLDEHARTLEVKVAEATRTLRQRETQLSLVVSNLPLAVLATDATGAITFAEGSSLSALQRSETALVGRPLREFLKPHAAALLALERAMTGLESMARVEIDDRVLELRISPSVQQNVMQGLACALFDITERERATAELDRLVLTDPLTALPNRRLFRDRLSQAIRSVERTRGPVSVLFLDLDHFKKVNDVHGHQTGDALIRQVGVRIGKTLRTTDTLGRLGGDEFAVVLPGLDVEAARVLASRIVAALAQPFFIDGVAIEAHVSIGISASPTDGFDADTLLRCADVAMFVAKRSGSGQQVYELSLDEASLRRQSLAADLVRALEAAPGEFMLVYQPIIEIATGKLRGVEALARWQHPERGAISPLECVALAAASNFSVALSDRVLDLALADFVAWRDAGFKLPVSVNLSARDLVDEDLAERVATKLTEHGVRPADLSFEINERALTADPTLSVMSLEKLSSLGIAIVLDDFGGGGASISDLARLPLTTVKINAAIVRGIGAAHAPTPIARAAIDLAHALGYLAVAKGVEGSEPLESLRELGCDHAQGHYLARPMSASEVLEWARGHTAGPGSAERVPVSVG